MSSILTRDEIIGGIRELIIRLRAGGSSATIQIVGGAAVALTVDADRPATVDIDGRLSPLEEVKAVAVQIAAERGWAPDWVNDKAKIFLPDGMGRSAEWITLYDKDGILVQTASPAMLLAMKLRALERRGLRDIGDVAVLLAVTGIGTADAAEELLNEFFPGEDLSRIAYERVKALLDAGLPAHEHPALPDFS